jgi:hypothetical protein
MTKWDIRLNLDTTMYGRLLLLLCRTLVVLYCCIIANRYTLCSCGLSFISFRRCSYFASSCISVKQLPTTFVSTKPFQQTKLKSLLTALYIITSPDNSACDNSHPSSASASTIASHSRQCPFYFLLPCLICYRLTSKEFTESTRFVAVQMVVMLVEYHPGGR